MVNIYVFTSFFLLLAFVITARALMKEMKNKILLKKELKNYETIIHDIADHMHNIGDLPLSEKGNEPYVSSEDLIKFRIIFRIMRRICQDNFLKKTSLLNEILELLGNIVQKRKMELLTIEKLEEIERELNYTHYGVVERLLKELNDIK